MNVGGWRHAIRGLKTHQVLYAIKLVAKALENKDVPHASQTPTLSSTAIGFLLKFHREPVAKELAEVK